VLLPGWNIATKVLQHFHQFIDALEERGVDMKKAKISKAEAALWGYDILVCRVPSLFITLYTQD
jgi:hypothetical protein